VKLVLLREHHKLRLLQEAAEENIWTKWRRRSNRTKGIE
jgi:hypothetical protein